MLNTGDTALPWEPYTGGAPSPSTDYPQEIVSKCQARQLLNDDNFYDLMLADKTPVFNNPRILNATDKYGTIKTTIDTPGTYTLSCDSNYYFMANRQYLNGEPVISISRKLPYTFEVTTPGKMCIRDRNMSVDIDYERLGREYAKAMDGVALNMDGQPVGEIVTPYEDKNMGSTIDLKKRGAL